jgi:hypothetical protein
MKHRSPKKGSRSRVHAVATLVMLVGACVANRALSVPAHVPTAPPSPSRDATAVYQELFGEKEKHANESGRSAAKFAIALMESVKDLVDDPQLSKVLCEKAYAYGIRDQEGYAAAEEALRILRDSGETTDKQALDQKLIELYKLEVKARSGTERTAAAQQLLSAMTSDAESLAVANKFNEASREYHEAVTVATQNHLPQAAAINGALRDIQSRQQSFEKLQKLEAQFAQSPDDEPLRQQIIEMYLNVFDNPAAALTRLGRNTDAETSELVTLASKPKNELNSDERLRAAALYKKLADRSASASKLTPLARCESYAAEFLLDHPAHDGDHIKATMLIEGAAKQLNSLPVPSGSPIRAIIWNTHNSKFNDRGAVSGNVILFLSGMPVWRKDAVRFEWVPSRDCETTVPLPSLVFDAIRIEITATRENGGGLTEVEVIRDGNNIALNAPVTASGSYPGFPGECITDGIKSSAEHKKGYWLLPNASLGWAVIDLKRTAKGEKKQ